MAKKEISKFLGAAIKRTAMNCSQLTTKKAKLTKEIAEKQAELESIQVQLDSFQAPIKEATGGYTTEDLVRREIVDTGKVDKDGKPIKQTKYVFIYPDTIIPPTDNENPSSSEAAEAAEVAEPANEEANEPAMEEGTDSAAPSEEV